MEQETGLRERKKQRTRSELEAAALRLFTERGFDAVTVDDIAAAADVSARTFFRHFGSKDDLLLIDYRERLDALRAALEKRPADENPLTAVRHAIIALAHDYESEKDSLFLRSRLMAETPSLVGRSLEIQQQWEAALAETVAARLGVDPATDMRPSLVGACAVAALRVAVNTWLADDGRGHLPSMVEAALLLVASGGDANRWRAGEGLQTESGTVNRNDTAAAP